MKMMNFMKMMNNVTGTIIPLFILVVLFVLRFVGDLIPVLRTTERILG
jgi:hypothetical protein